MGHSRPGKYSAISTNGRCPREVCYSHAANAWRIGLSAVGALQKQHSQASTAQQLAEITKNRLPLPVRASFRAKL